MQAAMVSTNRRSPRYLGNYDDTGATIDEENKETHQPTLLTQRKDNNTIEAPIKGGMTIKAITIQEEDQAADTKRIVKGKKTSKVAAKRDSIKVAINK